jgi:hypothetical protein
MAVVFMLAMVIGVTGTTATDVAAQDTLQCRWKSLGQSTLARYYEASAFDTVENQFFYYGGLDAAQQTQDDLGMLDLSDPNLDAARHRTIPVSAARRYGAAAAHRVSGMASSIYFFGGADDASDGKGTSDVQKLRLSDLSWSKPGVTGTLEARFFAAAAYDPAHDMIVITGGLEKCDTSDLPCNAGTFRTQFATFDSSGNVTIQDGPEGGPVKLFGHTMVYDSAAKRMIVYGGAASSDSPQGKVYVLDLSDPDPAKAAWSELTAQGGPAGLALHGAAYDAKRNWLVVYGGATRNVFAPGEEVANSKTYALDLGSGAPTWTDLGATFGERVGGVMAYDPKHEVPVYHAGRRRAKSGDTSDAFRDSHALVCEGEPGPTQTPGGPTNTTVPPTATWTSSPVPPTVTPTTVPPTETPTTPPPATTVAPTETTPPPATTVVPTETTPPPATTVVPTETTPPPATTVVPSDTPTTAPPATTVVPSDTPTTPPPATTEVPTNTPSIPSGSPTPTLAVGRVCEYILDRVPAQVINSAVTNPDTVAGWKQLCDPNKPASRFNYPRSWLSIQHVGQPYHPLYNSLAWKCGCP